MKALWVIPSIDPAWRDACLATLKTPNWLILNNAAPNPNRGVSASWNLGVDAARALHAEHLIICSEAVRFGEPGGLDFEAALTGPVTTAGMTGCHLLGIATATLEHIGGFDEQFFAYYEDTDWLRRATLAGVMAHATQVHVDATDAGVAHSLAWVDVNFGALATRYAAKWGGPPGHETWLTPYGRAESA